MTLNRRKLLHLAAAAAAAVPAVARAESYPSRPLRIIVGFATETEKWAKVLKFANIKPE